MTLVLVAERTVEYMHGGWFLVSFLVVLMKDLMTIDNIDNLVFEYPLIVCSAGVI